jgi:hypothetical protein
MSYSLAILGAQRRPRKQYTAADVLKNKRFAGFRIARIPNITAVISAS